MPMVRIREMRVAVRNRDVPVRVGMTHSGHNPFFMQVVVVFVAGAVHMRMAVLKRLMGMCMLVAFRQMQPDPARHQTACDDQ